MVPTLFVNATVFVKYTFVREPVAAVGNFTVLQYTSFFFMVLPSLAIKE